MRSSTRGFSASLIFCLFLLFSVVPPQSGHSAPPLAAPPAAGSSTLPSAALPAAGSSRSSTPPSAAWSSQGAAGPVRLNLYQYVPLSSSSRGNEVFPLIVRVENPGDEIRGELVAHFVAKQGMGQYADSYNVPVVQPVTIPPQSRLQFSFPMPAYQVYFFDKVAAELRQGSHLLQRADLTVKQHSGLAVLVFSDSQRGAAQLGKLDLSKIPAGNYFQGMAVTYADPTLLPADWRLLRPVSLVIFDDFAMERLSPEVERAMTQWTLEGGQMVLFPEAYRQRHSSHLLQRLLARGGSPEIKQAAGAPLADFHRYPFGNGTVILVNPGVAEALWKEKGKGSVWLSLLQASHSFPWQQTPLSFLTSVATKKIAPGDLPYLLLFFILYITIVGPGQYLYLKRKGRLTHLLTGTAICSLCFFTGFFLMAAARMGTRTTFLQYSLFALPSGETETAVTSYAAFFSVRERRYTFQSRLSSPLIMQERNAQSSQDRFPRQVLLGAGYALDGVKVPIWREERFQVDGTMPLRGSVRLSSNGSLLQVENLTGLTLRDCHYLSGGVTYYLCRDLPPGIKEFDLSRFSPRQASQMVQGSGQGGGPPEGLDWTGDFKFWSLSGTDEFKEVRSRILLAVAAQPALAAFPRLIARIENLPGMLDAGPGQSSPLHEVMMVVHGHD